MNIYDEVCEVLIQTEGYKSGYVVRIVGEDDTKTYHLEKDDVAEIIQKLKEIATKKGDTAAFWQKVA
jgi:hypothetical protein